MEQGFPFEVLPSHPDDLELARPLHKQLESFPFLKDLSNFLQWLELLSLVVDGNP